MSNIDTEGGIIKITAQEIPDLWQKAGLSQEQTEAILNDINLGSPYFVSKDQLEEESQKRLKALLGEPPQEFTEFREE